MLKKPQPLTVSFVIAFVVYQCLWHLIAPLAVVRLWYKGKKEPGYRLHLLERFGFYEEDDFLHAVWVHAVSVGETRAAAPLIEKLIAAGQRVLLTHMTPTGRQTGAELFSSQITQHQLIQRYIPYDFLWPISRFYRHYAPVKGILIETEIWPGVLFFARSRFPIYLINGRLSIKSSMKFARYGKLSQSLFSLFQRVLAQTNMDQENYQLFGVNDCVVTGNLKFDVILPQEKILQGQHWKTLWQSRQVVCAASTREGEENLIINAWKKMNPENRPLLFIVPRHLPRVKEIEEILHRQQMIYTKRSQIQDASEVTSDVLIGDTMGEMAFYLSCADYVLMGGTLMGTGGQNLIEPLSLGKPVILGPSTYNFAQICQDAIVAGIAIPIRGDTEESLQIALQECMENLIKIPQIIQNMATLSRGYAQLHQGATEKTLEGLNY
jgi:3-deoxy-D-manno-octulosonic-acid transferase